MQTKRHDFEVMDIGCCVPHMELAQAYVCPQKLEIIFAPEDGLKHGTIFPSLVKQYQGRVQE